MEIAQPHNLRQLTLSVVFSFRNEEESFPLLLPRLRAACTGLGIKDWEFVFVNDCSTDRSLEFLLQEQENHGDVVIVNMARRSGVSECVIAGLAEARGDYVVYMDADLQDPPELIRDMVLLAIKEQAHVVYTTRRSCQGETWIKLQVTKFGYWLLRTFSSIDIPYNSGDFKLLSRRVVQEILRLKEQKPFMRGLVTWVGFKQVQLMYDRDPRARGASHFPVFSKHVLYYFMDTALISFSDAPLKAALGLGLLMTLVSCGMLIWIFIQKMMGMALPGWSAVMVSIFVLGGMQLFVLGVLGLYIHTIYLQVKARPLYIVEQVLRPPQKPAKIAGRAST
jgi:polyisoprenyl-phosphate glycosyltransferase